MPVPGVNSTSACVSSEVGGVPALPSAADSAIEKQDEWAAAISSSGLVLPFASSARDGPGHVEGADAGGLHVHLAGAVGEAALPVGLRDASGAHAGITPRVFGVVASLPRRCRDPSGAVGRMDP